MNNKKISFFVYALSIVCVIHCIALPALIVAAPIVGGFFENFYAEIGFLILSVFSGFYIVYKGYSSHKKRYCISLYLIGALLWGVHSLFEHYGIFGAKIYFYFGTILVLLSYFINHRLLHSVQSKSYN